MVPASWAGSKVAIFLLFDFRYTLADKDEILCSTNIITVCDFYLPQFSTTFASFHTPALLAPHQLWSRETLIIITDAYTTLPLYVRIGSYITSPVPSCCSHWSAISSSETCSTFWDWSCSSVALFLESGTWSVSGRIVWKGSTKEKLKV